MQGNELADTRLPVALGVVLLGLMLFLIYTQVNRLDAARQEKAAQEVVLAEARQRLYRLEILHQHQDAFKEYLAEIDRMLPARPEEDVLIGDLRGYAAGSGLYFREIRFNDTGSKTGYCEMPFTAAFEGKYAGVLDLLNSLQYGPRAIRIDEIKITRGQQASSYVRLEVKARAFYRAGPQTAAPAG